MHFGFIMDPPSGINPETDTTYALMLAAQKRGHEISYIAPEDVSLEGATCWLNHQACTISPDDERPFNLETAVNSEAGAFDALFIRKDPPFDVPYLHLAHLMAYAKRDTFVFNDPAGLRSANEKLFAMRFEDLMPDTVVTRSRERIRAFMSEQPNGRCVLKPIDGYGGRNIFVLDSDDRNCGAIIDSMTGEGSERVVCQEYMPEARKGDKRIMLLEGQPLGAILRVPSSSDHRGNLHVGGQPQGSTLTNRDQQICKEIADELNEFGLWFAGIDIIGDRLTEINVTSPTGIQEIARLTENNPAERVIDWVELQAN
jgi:glutathione synthase